MVATAAVHTHASGHRSTPGATGWNWLRADAGFWLTLLMVVWIGVCITWSLVRWGDATEQLIFGLYYDVPFGPLLFWLCRRVARHDRIPPQIQRGWGILGVAYLIYWCGNCIWNFYEGVLQIDPFPSLADPFFLAFYPLAIYGLSCFTGRLQTGRDQAKFALDCATATVSVVGLLWYLALRHVEIDFEHGWVGAFVSVAYPIVDVLLLIAVISAMLKRQTTVYLGPLVLLLASYVAMLVADMLFLVPALQGEYASGGAADIFFLLSFGLIACGAQLQYSLGDGEHGTRSAPVASYAIHMFPYGAVGAVYSLLMWETRFRWFEPDGMLLCAAMLTTGLVIARQVFANRENAELSAAHATHASEARYTSLVKNSSDLVLVVDEFGVVSFVAPSSERMFGIHPDAIVGRALVDFTHPNDNFNVGHFCRDLSEDPALTGPVEWRLRSGDGDWRYVEVIGSNLIGDEMVRGLVLNARDITERKRLEEELKHLAFTDTLTLLANRNLFNEELALALARADGAEAYPILMFVDLDNFKKINDSLGHEAGDKLLAVAARRLIRATRTCDTVARLGGDEFALLIGGETTDEYAEALAGRLVDTLSAPYEIDSRQLMLSASVGVARGDKGLTAQELMRNADLAMYRAKGRGKRCFEVFEPALYTAVKQSVDLEMEMARALERGEFVPYFQPIVDLRTSEIVGVEALVRWQHPSRGLLLPGTFIQIAEDSGLIERLGEVVLFEACRLAAQWLATSKPDRPMHIAVNVSGRQIEHTDLASVVQKVIEQWRIPPQSLVLEITESVLMKNVTAAIEQLSKLKQIGVRIALDDFGTGYSSLSHVHRFPIDILKIDRSFVDGLRKGDGSELVHAIVTLAHALDLDVVAEGIERIEQLMHLQRLGCSFGQGYYFARPEPAEAIGPLLKSSLRLPRLSLVNND